MSSSSPPPRPSPFSSLKPYTKYAPLLLLLIVNALALSLSTLSIDDDASSLNFPSRSLKDGKNALTGHKYTSIFIDPPPLFPITSRTILGFTLSIFGLLLAAGGGIGEKQQRALSDEP